MTEELGIFKFNCDPDYLPEAAKYFTAFGLGNNHSDNQGGGTGLTTTRKYLDQNKIQYFGTPKYSSNVQSELARDTAEATNCDVVVLPIKVTYDNSSTFLATAIESTEELMIVAPPSTQDSLPIVCGE